MIPKVSSVDTEYKQYVQRLVLGWNPVFQGPTAYELW